LSALLSRWYAFGPWILIVALIWRQYGWRRALPIALGGWAITFAAEWSSTAGPGVPFGSYSYRNAGLLHDWRILGVPVFDSLSFTWLAFSTYILAGKFGARGLRRLLWAALAMVAIDVVVDPVALRGAQWWLGSIYSYPPHTGVWYGVSALNYLGWFVVGLALQLWLGFWLGDRPRLGRGVVAVSAVLLVGVLIQSAVLAVMLGIAPSELLAVGILAALVVSARGLAVPAPKGVVPTLIVACALSAEAKAARSGLGRGWSARRSGDQWIWRRARHPEVEIWEAGMGLEAANAAAQRAVGAGVILVVGFGGACSSAWELGGLAVGSRVLSPDGVWEDLNSEAGARLIKAQTGRTAQLGTSWLAADSAGERAALSQRGVEIVDMETAAWARLGLDREGTRVAALRVVSDTPQAPLGAAATLVEPQSSVPSPLRVARLLVLHPGAVRDLLTLGRTQGLALKALSHGVALAVPVLLELAREPAETSQDDRTPVAAG
jgi:nucleoside phosphorylase